MSDFTLSEAEDVVDYFLISPLAASHASEKYPPISSQLPVNTALMALPILVNTAFNFSAKLL
jgi:hypothetical protein